LYQFQEDETPVADSGATLDVGATKEDERHLVDEVEPSPSSMVPSKVVLAGKEVREPLVGAQGSTETKLDFNLIGHVVTANDTLTEIATRNDTSVTAIQELNGLVDPNSLLIGQQLLIPKGYYGPDVLAKALERVEFLPQVIGLSAGGHPIEAFQIGDGTLHVLVVGAIHGGYEWNTALLAFRLITYFSIYPEVLPTNVSLHIVPVANPDGIEIVTGAPGPFALDDLSDDTRLGRLNGNGVDLNRNWGCDWSAQGRWGQEIVSGGTRPLSEPENRAMRQYINDTDPEVVIWLHSAAGLLVPGNCNDIGHSASERAAALYALESGYPVGEFSAYIVTGDAADWLAQHKIASFTVELSNHQALEFDRNLAGLLSLLEQIETLDE
jgi:LysM repeat protein